MKFQFETQFTRSGTTQVHTFIVEAYPALRLDDVYAVIAYVLRHPAEVKAYMQDTEVAEQHMLEKVKTWFPESPALRARAS
jgi:hypothetical protein